MNTHRIPLLIVASSAALIAACGPVTARTPTPDLMSVQATAVSGNASAQIAVAQATYAAQQANIRATAEWQATDTAINATLSAHDIGYLPTRAAVQATLDAARAGEAQANLDLAKMNVAIEVTRQAANVQLQSLEVLSKTSAVNGQMQAQQATATAVAKQIQNSIVAGDVYGLTDLIASALIKIGVPAVLLIGALIGLRKWQQKDIVQQPHPDGPMVEIRHNLLKGPEAFVIWNPFEERARYALPAPRVEPEVQLDAAPVYQNGNLRTFVESATAREASEAELMRRRVLNFLRLVIEYYADDTNDVVVPRWDALQPLAEEHGADVSSGSNEWMAVTDSLAAAGCISKAPGKKTLLIGEYMTFAKLYGAVGQKRIPLPVVIRQASPKTVETVQYATAKTVQTA